MTEKTQYTEQLTTLRNWLKVNRKAQNIPMRTVASRLNVPHSWVAKTENGERRLDILEFVNLCFALGLDPHKGLNLVIASHPPQPLQAQPSMLAAEPPPRYGSKPRRAGK